MRIGVHLIGIFIIVDIGQFIYNISKMLAYPPLDNNFAIIYGVLHLGMLVAIGQFIVYWINDKYETRKRLPTACLWTTFVNLACVILSIVSLAIDWIAAWRFWQIIGGQVLYFFIYIYCMGITKRWANMRLLEDNERLNPESIDEEQDDSGGNISRSDHVLTEGSEVNDKLSRSRKSTKPNANQSEISELKGSIV